jgi:hypothetical protein
MHTLHSQTQESKNILKLSAQPHWKTKQRFYVPWILPSPHMSLSFHLHSMNPQSECFQLFHTRHLKVRFTDPVYFLTLHPVTSCTLNISTYNLIYAWWIISLLTPWSWALLEKPPFAQLLKNFPKFYGTLGFIPCPKEPSTGLCPEPDQSSPHHPILSL